VMPSIDVNCDLGEGCGNDERLMELITSANVACGYHAGDVDTMKRTVDLALENGVAIGAHPSYHDPDNFGRTDMELPPGEIAAIVTDQLESFRVICDAAGAKIRHVKPHGALYNRSARDAEVAEAIAGAVKRFDADAILFGLSGSHSTTAAKAIGLKTANEVFADRTYASDGSLTPRSEPNALIGDEREAVSRVLDMVRYGRVRATDGIMIRISAETLCIHGDGPRAVEIALNLREDLTRNRIEIKPVHG
jgi:5-oxoprolinase (ATP-hydrolysing) subunit A